MTSRVWGVICNPYSTRPHRHIRALSQEYVQITLVRIIPKAGSGTLLHLSYSALGFSPVKISLSITNTYEKPPRPILDANYGIVKQEG